MIATKVICDVCKEDAPGSDTTIVGGKVHVCSACNKGGVNDVLRAFISAWPRPCHCTAYTAQMAGLGAGQWQNPR